MIAKLLATAETRVRTGFPNLPRKSLHRQATRAAIDDNWSARILLKFY
jgi:hypothetical protein